MAHTMVAFLPLVRDNLLWFRPKQHSQVRKENGVRCVRWAHEFQPTGKNSLHASSTKAPFSARMNPAGLAAACQCTRTVALSYAILSSCNRLQNAILPGSL